MNTSPPLQQTPPSHSNEPVLVFDNVGVRYRKKLSLFDRQGNWALRHLNFQLFHGETLGVVGKNGAGKSTLLKLMAGIITPDEGRIVKNINTVQLLSLQVGFLQHLSGRENAILSGVLLGMTKQQVVDAMDSIIDFTELGAKIDDPVQTYSSGMKMRLGFAVANQSNPDILLIDEVLGVGDAQFKKKSRKVMIDRISSDKTVVLVSHHEDTIAEFCDRVIWLNQGESAEIGESTQVMDHYGEAAKK